MKKLLVIFLLMIFICSCHKDKIKIIEDKITGKGYKYWLFVKKIPMLEESKFGFDNYLSFEYYDDHGNFHYLYYYMNDMKEKVRSDIDNNGKIDFIESHAWSLKNDSIIVVNGLELIIKCLTPDLMILMNPKTNVYSYYVSTPMNLLPEKFHQKYPWHE